MITLLTRNNRRRGFTITELLVVIGLIVLLIGILLPALAAVKSSGMMTKLSLIHISEPTRPY